MSKVEEVAKAILAESKNFGALAHHLKGAEAIEMRLARAAIEAMREPTEAMLRAGSMRTGDAFRAMVEAALSEQEQG
jgi:hypothetical protein